MRGTQGESGGDFRLTLHPGKLYRWSLLIPSVSGVGLVLGLLVAPDFGDVATVVFLSFCTALLVGGVVNVLYWKADRTLIVDSHGIRLLRSGKTTRDIRWEYVERIRYGMAFGGTGTAAPQDPLFWVHTKGPSRGLSVLESSYKVSPGSVWDAALFAAGMAGARGIPVVWKDGLIRDFGP